MRLVSLNDTVEFTDDNGDKLICLKEPRWRHHRELQDFILQNATKYAGLVELFKSLGVKEVPNNTPDTPEVQEFKFRAVAVAMVIGGEKITDSERLLQIYNDASIETANWINECVAKVWEQDVKKK